MSRSISASVRRPSDASPAWCYRPPTGARPSFPRGFAHGFIVSIRDRRVHLPVHYFYHPGDEYAALWNDPALWRSRGGAEAPELAPRDASYPKLSAIASELLPRCA